MGDNVIYCGDNLDVLVLRRHVRDKKVGHRRIGVRNALTAGEGHVCSC